MPKVVDPDKIPITTPAQLAQEFAALQVAFDLAETEHTWEKIDKAVKRFHAVVRGGACKLTKDFVDGMRSPLIVKGIVRSVSSERTRLSASALDLVASTTRLCGSFSPLLAPYGPPLLRLLCRTNKLYIQRASATLTAIITHTKPVALASHIANEWKHEGGKSASYRIACSELLVALVNAAIEDDDFKAKLEPKMDEVEWLLKQAATDREAKARAEAKKVWDLYKQTWPERVQCFTGPMTPTIRRYLAVPAATATATGATATSSSLATSTRTKPLTNTTSTTRSLTTSTSTRPPSAPSRSAHAPPTRPLSASAGPAPSPAPGPSRPARLEQPAAERTAVSRSTAGPSVPARAPVASRTALAASTSSTGGTVAAQLAAAARAAAPPVPPIAHTFATQPRPALSASTSASSAASVPSRPASASSAHVPAPTASTSSAQPSVPSRAPVSSAPLGPPRREGFKPSTLAARRGRVLPAGTEPPRRAGRAVLPPPPPEPVLATPVPTGGPLRSDALANKAAPAFKPGLALPMTATKAGGAPFRPKPPTSLAVKPAAAPRERTAGGAGASTAASRARQAEALAARAAKSGKAAVAAGASPRAKVMVHGPVVSTVESAAVVGPAPVEVAAAVPLPDEAAEEAELDDPPASEDSVTEKRLEELVGIVENGTEPSTGMSVAESLDVGSVRASASIEPVAPAAAAESVEVVESVEDASQEEVGMMSEIELVDESKVSVAAVVAAQVELPPSPVQSQAESAEVTVAQPAPAPVAIRPLVNLEDDSDFEEEEDARPEVIEAFVAIEPEEDPTPAEPEAAVERAASPVSHEKRVQVEAPVEQETEAAEDDSPVPEAEEPVAEPVEAEIAEEEARVAELEQVLVDLAVSGAGELDGHVQDEDEDEDEDVVEATQSTVRLADADLTEDAQVDGPTHHAGDAFGSHSRSDSFYAEADEDEPTSPIPNEAAGAPDSPGPRFSNLPPQPPSYPHSPGLGMSRRFGSIEEPWQTASIVLATPVKLGQSGVRVALPRGMVTRGFGAHEPVMRLPGRVVAQAEPEVEELGVKEVAVAENEVEEYEYEEEPSFVHSSVAAPAQLVEEDVIEDPAEAEQPSEAEEDEAADEADTEVALSVLEEAIVHDDSSEDGHAQDEQAEVKTEVEVRAIQAEDTSEWEEPIGDDHAHDQTAETSSFHHAGDEEEPDDGRSFLVPLNDDSVRHEDDGPVDDQSELDEDDEIDDASVSTVAPTLLDNYNDDTTDPYFEVEVQPETHSVYEEPAAPTPPRQVRPIPTPKSDAITSLLSHAHGFDDSFAAPPEADESHLSFLDPTPHALTFGFADEDNSLDLGAPRFGVFGRGHARGDTFDAVPQPTREVEEETTEAARLPPSVDVNRRRTRTRSNSSSETVEASPAEPRRSARMTRSVSQQSLEEEEEEEERAPVQPLKRSLRSRVVEIEPSPPQEREGGAKRLTRSQRAGREVLGPMQ